VQCIFPATVRLRYSRVMIGIIDYGAGNLLSVRKALEYLGVQASVIAGHEKFKDIDKLILPGVGAFCAAMDKIKERGLYEPIAKWLNADRPFLGICLGMQLLFEQSEESPGSRGFGAFKGTVKRFTGHKVPQIGWNQVNSIKESVLCAGIVDGSYFYFLHGYYVVPEDASITTGVTQYQIQYTSIVEKGNTRGVQFHPEKSSTYGLKLLKNWVDLC
jgi:imidazole glycerol-phosphate synthase subunit HisH